MVRLFFTSSNKPTHTDEELVALYKETGEMHWLGELYQRYMHLVFGLCLKHYKDRERSKESVMEIFEKLTTEVKKHEIAYFKSWLYILVKNYCLMELRKDSSLARNYMQKISSEFMESTTLVHPIDEETDEHLIEALAFCMKQLNEWQRLCTDLFYYQKKSYKEICDVYNLTEMNVKSFIQNGKRNLKICIEQRCVA